MIVSVCMPGGSISIHALREEGDRTGTALWHLPLYFYPRPPRGGRPTRAAATGSTEPISIHALREEGDKSALSQKRTERAFLSTPSARRATMLSEAETELSSAFLSTPSARRATNLIQWRKIPMQFLSTPSARRATAECPIYYWYKEISIHALREEGDPGVLVCKISSGAISIHALREEGDRTAATLVCTPANFYPRPPRGGRRGKWPT